MENVNYMQNNYFEVEKEKFLKKCKLVRSLSIAGLSLNLIFVAFIIAVIVIACIAAYSAAVSAIASAVPGVPTVPTDTPVGGTDNPYYSGYAQVYDSYQASQAVVDGTLIISALLIFVFVSVFPCWLGVSIAAAVYASQVKDMLEQNGYRDNEGEVAFGCSIAAIFVIPVILQIVVAVFAGKLIKKANNNEISFAGPVQQSFGYNPYPNNPNGFNPYNPYSNGPTIQNN